MSDSPIIELDQVSKIYRYSHLGRVKETLGTENLSFSIKKGEVFGLLGLNGCGKTTTIKMILGLLFPTAGRIRVLGSSPEEPETKQKIGYLPEVPYFYKYLSAREVLAFYGQLSKIDARELPSRIEEVLEIVRMKDRADRPMRQFSKGMLQRTGLAQAMLHNPQVLIFDEPVTGLDPLGLKEMRDLLLNLNNEGKTIFFSSHSISEAEKVCHRVGIMKDGRLERIISKSEWAGRPGQLEKIFVEVVTSKGGVGVY